MPRSVATSVENNFVNGLITEATGLNFPENAVTESDNVDFDDIGKVSRRYGVDLEEDYSYINTSSAETVYNEFLWESVANEGNIVLHVQQIGNRILFYRVSTDTSLSGEFIGEFSLISYSPSSVFLLDGELCQFTSGFGCLFVTHPYCDPLYVTFDNDLNSIVVTAITIKTRDFIGVSDGDVQRLSTAPTPEHYYNLYNQGWREDKINTFFAQVSVYPADYDVWYLFKNSSEVFSPATEVASVDRGNAHAPTGSVIVNEFFQDRGALCVPTKVLPVVSSEGHKPATVEFFSGRVFYSGVVHRFYGPRVYFSQIVETVDQFGKCYQVNDPTSESLSDLLPSDGGVISIPDAGVIFKLWALDNSLLVFASNGIWQITGSSNLGFSATDYTVKRLSSLRTLSAYSFVSMLGYPVWWTADGIYTLDLNPGGGPAIKSLSNKKIDTFLDNIPTESKRYVKGQFNIEEKRIKWVYNPIAPTTINERFSYTKVLNYNVVTSAFFVHTFDTTNVKIRGIVYMNGLGSTKINEAVYDSLGNLVYDSLGNIVYVENTIITFAPSSFRFVIAYDSGTRLSFATQGNTTYTDWSTIPGAAVDAFAYFISGFKVRGGANRKFQANYVNIYTDNDLQSTFYIAGLWDYARSAGTNRWSALQKIIMNVGDYSNQNKRIKIRGHGKALQFKVTSEPLLPFDIIGWASLETGNSSP